MQNKGKYYLGMDVSKAWVDVAVLPVINHEKQPMTTNRFDNTVKGIKKLGQWLKQQQVGFDKNSLVVIENTGIYHRLIWQYCSEQGLPLYIGNAAHIKWSLGITRGKSDLMDCKRLCNYAFKQADELKASPVLDPVLLSLKDLMTTRSTLLQQKNRLQIQLREHKMYKTAAAYEQLAQALEPVIRSLKEAIKAMEREIKKVVAANAVIKKNYQLLNSVPGIGHFTAVYLICCSSNFAGKHSGKQIACYAGVVPFGHSSGSSVKGRDKVHKMANKTLKKMLHLGALTSIKNYPEFKDYYDRKKAEGKHPLSILNAIRNKLVLRAVAVIKNQKAYINNYQKAA